MSASIHELSDFISELLMVERFRDACENGLQVEGKGEVERIALGVSVTQALLDEAVGWQADAVLTHHGLFWQRDKQSIRGLRRQRLKTLLANDIHLLAYHLPLDAHPVLGNNAQLAQVISLTEVSPWLLVDGVPLGVIGSYPQPMSAAELEAQLALVFGARVLLLGERSRVVQRVAICSGRAASSLEVAARAGADLYLTGEADV
ncbi:MAG: Nif3-like dinuclear metal center hexameric protein, partial [Myxococcota bacterium]|nr:Nif3-like dinuclear metal center hexameric protein [Myxococcota bacterium]